MLHIFTFVLCVYVYLYFLFQGLRERSPHYHKLYARLTHIWGNRRGQPNRSAMEGPHPGGTAFMITVSPAPGKYDCTQPRTEFIASASIKT